MSAKTGAKGRKVGRNFRFHGLRQTTTSYRQRRMFGVPKGGDNGAWRTRTGQASA